MNDLLGASAVDAGFDVPMCALAAAAGETRIESLLRHIAADLDTYLRRTS